MISGQQDVQEATSEQCYPGLEIAFQEAKRQIDFQFNQADSLDVKASVCLGFSGVLLTLVLTVLPTILRHIDYLTIGLVLAESLYTLVSLISAIVVIFPRAFKNALSIESLRFFLVEQEMVAKYDLFQAFERVIRENHPRIQRKVHFVNLSVVFLLVGIVVFPGILFGDYPLTASNSCTIM